MSELNPYDIKHIKLSTGEEVLCEIIEEDEYDLVIRRALKLQTDIDEEGTRYHSFRTYMTYQDDPEVYVILKSIHVVSVTYPSPTMMKQYLYSISEVEKNRMMADEEEGMTSEDIYDRVLNSMGRDSNNSNVLQFPDPEKTVH
jgi:hypothetical protein